MSRIFISYSSQDRERVSPLVHALAGSGHSAFWDREIPPGWTWRQVLSRELTDAEKVIVVWSKYSVDAHWVLEEAEEARKRKVLVPVLLDGVTPPMGFRELQALDLTGWNGKADDPVIGRLLVTLDARPPIAEGPKAKEAHSRVGQRGFGATVLILASVAAGFLVIRATSGTHDRADGHSAIRPSEAPPSDTAKAITLPSSAPAPPGAIRTYHRIFYEDFSRKETLQPDIFLLGSRGDWEGQVVGGTYRLCNRSGADTASFTSVLSYLDSEDASAVDQADARVGVSVRLEGPLTKYSAAGMTYRASRQEKTYSAFALTAGHSVMLLRSQGNHVKIDGTWEQHGVKDGDTMLLRVEGDGPAARLYVNDTLVFTDTESNPRGNPGVFAMGRGCFVFDDVAVQLPR